MSSCRLRIAIATRSLRRSAAIGRNSKRLTTSCIRIARKTDAPLGKESDDGRPHSVRDRRWHVLGGGPLEAAQRTTPLRRFDATTKEEPAATWTERDGRRRQGTDG